MASLATDPRASPTPSDISTLLSLANTLVARNVWGRHQRTTLKEMVLGRSRGGPLDATLSAISAAGGDAPARMTDDTFRALDSLVYREICGMLTELGYRLTRASRAKDRSPKPDKGRRGDGDDGDDGDDVAMLATNLSLQDRGGGSDDENSDEALRATWVGAVVAGINQARPIPSGGKCCCLGTGGGLLAFIAVFFAGVGAAAPLS